MTVNNSAKIGTILSFIDKDDFYFVQILKRHKDNPDMERDMIVINNYYIESLDHFIKIVPHIIAECELENARAYIRLNRRNYKKLAPHMTKRVVDIAFGDNCRSLKGVFSSIAGEYHSDPDKKWLVDIDWKDLKTPYQDEEDTMYRQLLFELGRFQEEAKREPLLEILPTKNGVHIITRPFDLQRFRMNYPKMDIHKDATTMLYCP